MEFAIKSSPDFMRNEQAKKRLETALCDHHSESKDGILQAFTASFNKLIYGSGFIPALIAYYALII